MEIYLNEAHEKLSSQNYGYTFNEKAAQDAKRIAEETGKAVFVSVNSSNRTVAYAEHADTVLIGGLKNRRVDLDPGCAYSALRTGEYGNINLCKL